MQFLCSGNHFAVAKKPTGNFYRFVREVIFTSDIGLLVHGTSMVGNVASQHEDPWFESRSNQVVGALCQFSLSKLFYII